MIFPDLIARRGIAIGAVISPTDAVAATALGKKLGLPPRLVTILEGESLVNDATALVLLRSAIAATAATVTFWRSSATSPSLSCRDRGRAPRRVRHRVVRATARLDARHRDLVRRAVHHRSSPPSSSGRAACSPSWPPGSTPAYQRQTIHRAGAHHRAPELAHRAVPARERRLPAHGPRNQPHRRRGGRGRPQRVDGDRARADVDGRRVRPASSSSALFVLLRRARNARRHDIHVRTLLHRVRRTKMPPPWSRTDKRAERDQRRERDLQQLRARASTGAVESSSAGRECEAWSPSRPRSRCQKTPYRAARADRLHRRGCDPAAPGRHAPGWVHPGERASAAATGRPTAASSRIPARRAAAPPGSRCSSAPTSTLPGAPRDRRPSVSSTCGATRCLTRSRPEQARYGAGGRLRQVAAPAVTGRSASEVLRAERAALLTPGRRAATRRRSSPGADDARPRRDPAATDRRSRRGLSL